MLEYKKENKKEPNKMPRVNEYTPVHLFPGSVIWEEAELEEMFISYVRVGNEIVGLMCPTEPWISYCEVEPAEVTA
jgi:hypothetical protein